MLNETKILILACQGDELKAVKKGLFPLPDNSFFPLPIGCEAVDRNLSSKTIVQKQVLIIGLGGSLSPQYQVGDVVIYESCSYWQEGKINSKNCDRILTQLLQSQLNAPLVKGLTTDQLIVSPTEKLKLNQQSNCTVVDMETYAVMNYFSSVAIVRVISDNQDDSLPDLNSAIINGQLNPLKMSIAFIKEPFNAVKLITNALVSLNKLEQISREIKKLIVKS
jgi:hypothetical protein